MSIENFEQEEDLQTIMNAFKTETPHINKFTELPDNDRIMVWDAT